MVNLKEYLLDATSSEAAFLDALPSFFKYVGRNDSGFITKSVGAIREIFRDKNATVTEKYFCLQLINLGMRSGSVQFIETVEEKLLERLYLLAMFDYKNENFESRGRRLLKQFDEGADEEGSLRFYELLLECFSSWGSGPISRVPSFAAKSLALSQNVRLPTSFRWLDKYASNLKIRTSSSPPDKIDPSQGRFSTPQVTPDQVGVVLELLEVLSRNSGPEEEKKVRDALTDLQAMLNAYEDSRQPSSPETETAARILEGFRDVRVDFVGFLRKKLRQSSEPRMFDSPGPEQVNQKTTTGEEIRKLSSYVEDEREQFLRKIASLEDQLRQTKTEGRRLETRVSNLEADSREQEQLISELRAELSKKNKAFDQYVRSGLAFFKQSGLPSQFESSRVEISPKPSLDKRLFDTRELDSLYRDSTKTNFRSYAIEELQRPARSKAPATLDALRYNLANAESLVSEFTGDMGSTLGRNARSAKNTRTNLLVTNDPIFQEKVINEIDDLAVTKPRFQSAKLDEYMKKYSSGDPFDTNIIQRKSEPRKPKWSEREITEASSPQENLRATTGLSKTARKEGTVSGILKFKNV